jgi:hypothetical protein
MRLFLQWYLSEAPMSAIRDVAAAPDIINGCFEFIGALLVLNSIRVLLNDRAVAGVSVFSCCAFTTWGVWNLFYYPNLGQWFSFAGGACLCAMNFTWVGLMLFFRCNPVETTDREQDAGDPQQPGISKQRQGADLALIR